MKKLLLTSIILLFYNLSIIAQDSWSNVVNSGVTNSYNYISSSLHVFKGMLYVGMGADSAKVYRTATGNPNSWSNVLTVPNYRYIRSITSTSEGLGFMYVSAHNSAQDTSKIFRSVDGINWSTYFQTPNNITFIIPFKGAGTVDSMYVVNDGTWSSRILKSAYNSNDSLGLVAWDTVLNFDSILSGTLAGTRIKSITSHNGKLYIGTNNSCMLWSSSNGRTWTQNTNVGSGFGNPNNNEITALASYGGYLYAGTRNGQDGAQLWRSNDDVIWTLVQQHTPTYLSVSSLNNADGKLWATLETPPINGQAIYYTDGTTYSNSNPNGFGMQGIDGYSASITQFGNNIYWAGENYYMPAIAHPRAFVTNPINDVGAQIWRRCTLTPPTVSLGANQTVCAGIDVTFNAGPGYTAYHWSGGETTQTITAVYPGEYSVNVVGANGCDAIDTVSVINLISPDIYFTSPESFLNVLCKNDTIDFNMNTSSGLRIALPKFSSTDSTAILDYATAMDSLLVSVGFDDGAGNTLVSVTIDSLYHTDNSHLQFTLYAPNGSYAALQNYACNGQNFFGTTFDGSATADISLGTAPYTGAFIPTNSFPSYIYGPTNGYWALSVYDNYSGNTGFIKGWSLNFSEPDTNMTFSWSPAAGLTSSISSDTRAFGTTTTTYTITATNAIGCYSKDSVKIFVPSSSISASSPTACFGTSVTLTAVNNDLVVSHWSPLGTISSDTGSVITATPIANTMYYLIDTIQGCNIIDSVMINSNPALTAAAGPNQTICYADTANLTGAGSGGTPGYTFLWSNGANTSNTNVAPLSSSTVSLLVTDAVGCAAGDTLTISVTPSTDVFGHVSYSGGSVVTGNAVIYLFKPYFTHFDTLQVQPLNAAGDYHFTNINHGDYLIKIFADSTTYPTLNPTYAGTEWAWDSATVVVHGCNLIDTVNITMIEEIGLVGGPGILRGRITEDIGFGRTPGDPVPGIDVKLGKNPGGAMVTSTATSPTGAADGGGYYYFTNVPLNAVGESYTVYVDIPGLGRDSSYSVTLTATDNQFVYLDYIVDSVAIYIVPNAGVGISNPEVALENKFGVYPNPATKNATIGYTLVSDADVSLDVYNVLGIKTAALVNSKQSGGSYKVNLNALDNNLTNGIYFVSLSINGKTTIQRLVITD